MRIPYFYILENCYYDNEADSIICRLCDNDEIIKKVRKQKLKMDFEKFMEEHLIENHLSELVAKGI